MVAPAGEFNHGPRQRSVELAMNIYTDPAASATETATDSTAPQAQSWRDTLPIHPAAALFPRMSSDELRELGRDIRKNGLRSSIALWQSDKGASALLLDGISRLDAVEVELGRPVRVVPRTYRLRTRWSLETDEDGESVPVTNLIGEARNTTAEQQIFILLGREVDPWAYVISANLHRRHLTAEQKRDLIAKLIKATPEKSDRQIAETVKVSLTTVGTVRAEMEATGDVSKLDTRTDSKGRKQPARKTTTKPPPVSEEVLQQRAAAAERIRALMGGKTRDDIGPASNDEITRKDTLIEELQTDSADLKSRTSGCAARSKKRRRRASLRARARVVNLATCCVRGIAHHRARARNSRRASGSSQSSPLRRPWTTGSTSPNAHGGPRHDRPPALSKPPRERVLRLRSARDAPHRDLLEVSGRAACGSFPLEPQGRLPSRCELSRRGGRGELGPPTRVLARNPARRRPTQRQRHRVVAARRRPRPHRRGGRAMKRREKDQELADPAYLLRAWRRHHREQLQEALAGVHGAVLERLMAKLKDLRSARELVAFIEAQDWASVDSDTRAIALFEIDRAIVALRERTDQGRADRAR